MGFAFAVILIALMGPCQAQGQETCRSGLSLRFVDMTHEQVDGFFISARDVACMTFGLERVPPLEAQIARMERRRDMAEARYTELLDASALATRVISSYTQALDAAMRRTVNAEAANDSFWSSPYFWYVAGLITAAAVAVALWVGGE